MKSRAPVAPITAIVVLAAALLLAACGSSDNNSTSTSSTLPPWASIRAVASSRVMVGRVPVSTKVFLAKIPAAVEAALGSKIEVPTIDGRSVLKIPPGTQSGQKLRLREKGVPSATQDGVRGDEIVEVKITVPMPRDEKTKELLRELAKLNPEDPREELWKQV